MALDFAAKRTVTLCAGVSESGKSTFALRYLLNAPLSWRFIFDPENEYSDRIRLAPALDGIDLDEHLKTGWVIFDSSILFPGNVEAGFAFFCDWAFQMSSRLPGQKVLVCDEVWKYCSPYAIPEELATVVQMGRKRGLGLFINTQEPQRLHGRLLNELSEFVCFQLQFPRALEFVSAYGFNPEEIRTLPALHYVSRNCKSGGELRGALRL